MLCKVRRNYEILRHVKGAVQSRPCLPGGYPEAAGAVGEIKMSEIILRRIRKNDGEAHIIISGDFWVRDATTDLAKLRAEFEEVMRRYAI